MPTETIIPPFYLLNPLDREAIPIYKPLQIDNFSTHSTIINHRPCKSSTKVYYTREKAFVQSNVKRNFGLGTFQEPFKKLEEEKQLNFHNTTDKNTWNLLHFEKKKN